MECLRIMETQKNTAGTSFNYQERANFDSLKERKSFIRLNHKSTNVALEKIFGLSTTAYIAGDIDINSQEDISFFFKLPETSSYHLYNFSE